VDDELNRLVLEESELRDADAAKRVNQVTLRPDSFAPLLPDLRRQSHCIFTERRGQFARDRFGGRQLCHVRRRQRARLRGTRGRKR
jgi:hypothetical protein